MDYQDRLFVGKAPSVPDDKPEDQQLKKTPTTDYDDKVVKKTEEECRTLLENWKRFTERALIGQFFRLPGMLSHTQQLLENARDLTGKIAKHMELDGDNRVLNHVSFDLSKITSVRAYKHIMNVSSTLALLWPLMILMIGVALEYLVKLVIPLPAGSESIPKSIDFLLSFAYKYNFDQLFIENFHLVNIPIHFPGGSFFFWMFVIYPLFAWTVTYRAYRNLKVAESTESRN